MLSLINNLQIDLAVEKSVLEIETGMASLLQGQLPPVLVSYQDLIKSVRYINNKLSTLGSYQVKLKSAYDFYSSTEYAVHREGGFIFIHMAIPVVDTSYAGMAYQVIHFDVKLNQSSSDVSRLRKQSNYVIFSNDDRFVAEVQDIHLHVKYLEHVPLYKSNENCYYLIRRDRRSDIMKYCIFDVVLGGASSFIVPVHTTQVNMIILSEIDFYEEHCSGKTPNKIKGCENCIIRVQCFCTINFYIGIHIPVQFTKCLNDSQHSERRYIFNLPIAIHKYGAEMTSIMTPDAKYKEFEIDLYDGEKYDKLTSSMIGKVIEIQNFVKKLNESDTSVYWDVDLSDETNEIMIITISIILGIVVLVSGILSYKVYSLSILLTSCIQQTSADKFPFPTDSPINDRCNSQINVTNEIPLMYWISFTLLIIVPIATRIINRIFCKIPNNTLCLQIISSDDCITIPIMKLNKCVFLLHFMTLQNLTQFHVSGYIFPCLKYKRNDFTIDSLTTNEKFLVPTNVKLNFWQGIKVRKLFSKEDSLITLVASHEEGVLVKINICTPHCQTCPNYMKKMTSPVPIEFPTFTSP